MSVPAGPGVKSFPIIGPMQEMRYRCSGMTSLERQWRAQFLKDQILSPKEPRDVPELYKDTTNFMRRLWRTPMWNLQKALSAVLGKTAGYHMRHLIGKGIGVLLFTYFVAYHVKYNSNDWTRRYTLMCFSTRKRIFMGEPGYENFSFAKTDQEYFDLGFSSSPLAKKIEAPNPVPQSPPKMLKGGVEVPCPKE